MKNHSNDICANCGASEGLHHYESRQCPQNGREEYREGYKQIWAETIFQDSGIKKFQDKAINMHDELIETIEKASFHLGYGNTSEALKVIHNQLIKK